MAGLGYEWVKNQTNREVYEDNEAKILFLKHDCRSLVDYIGLDIALIFSKKRTPEIADARALFFYYMYNFRSLSHKECAYFLNRTDHTASISACNNAEYFIEKDENLSKLFESFSVKEKPIHIIGV